LPWHMPPGEDQTEGHSPEKLEWNKSKNWDKEKTCQSGKWKECREGQGDTGRNGTKSLREIQKGIIFIVVKDRPSVNPKGNLKRGNNIQYLKIQFGIQFSQFNIPSWSWLSTL
jgi:hypothetical protein